MQARKTMPVPLRRLLDRMMAADRGPVAWLQDRAIGTKDLPEPLTAESSLPTRVFVAPMNYAGQGWEWVRSLRGADIEARNLSVDFEWSFRFPADRVVPASVFVASRTWRAGQRAALPGFTHVMIESFTSPLGRGTGKVIGADIDELRRHGVAVALICHGTDVRVPSSHRARNPHSPFPELPPREQANLERMTRENLGIIERFDGPVFVSTPDLLVDVPGAAWLPVVVEQERWRSANPVDREVPVVLHVPSSAPIKGTPHVTRAAEALAGRSLISYRPLQGIPAARMPEEVATADILVDQLMIGSYGVAACEAMAAGRVVVGNVDPQVRAHVAEATGLEVPIVQADPDTLEDVLAQLAADPAARVAAAAPGPEFVDRVHSGARTRAVLAGFLGVAPLG